ncbi:response regulator transcription factor [Chengkuizengella sediminis]|uniref:response regulator transcription factor n=1 Tax=Chengkuizengella sediminis TaxID=1885917 RepID=UPI00138A672B|nr:response regulator transcription factor [Chengkuizengella sediminis]NDI35089.1 response regulator transcription factor [Chengkuizengella sediminis]
MYTVMIVDDEMYVRKGLRNLIDWESNGYIVIDEAEDGEDALSLIQEINPDLVITDIRMPVIDGLQLIHKVKELKMETNFIIISGYNDFDYAKQAVRYDVHDYILKPIDQEEMTRALLRLGDKINQRTTYINKNNHLLYNQMMDGLFRGEFTEDELLHWSNKIQMNPSTIYYYAFIEVNDIHHRKDDVTTQVEQMKENIQVFVTSSRAINHSNPIYLYEHHGKLGMIITDNELGYYQGDVNLFAVKLKQVLMKEQDINVYIYIGKPTNLLCELSISYQSAKEVLQYKYLKDETQIVTFNDVQKHSLKYTLLDLPLYQSLLMKVEEQHESEIRVIINQIFEDFRMKCYAVEAVKASIQQCVHGLLEIIHNMSGDVKQTQTIEPIISWNDNPLTLNELHRLFSDFIIECRAVIHQLRIGNVRGEIEKVKQYVEKNYHENLKLKKIAERFYMNPVYLGQLFKKTYGLYFNEYLLELRIREAKKLLRQTDHRIYEIAEKIGFNNPDYFVTQFEKIEHITPSEYRSNLIK